MANIKRAKITRPDIQSALKRSRLLYVLGRSSRKPVIWITAPAGAGKTTLVSSYIEEHNLPCLWYQLDENDADPATFFYYFKAAAAEIDPAAAASLPFLTPEYAQGMKTFAGRNLETVLTILRRASRSQDSSATSQEPAKDINAALTQDFSENRTARGNCLVLDNYQEVPEDSLLHSLLASALEYMPRGVSLIVTSRNHPPAQYSRLRAGNMIAMLEWDEIRFSLEETRSLLDGLLQHDDISRLKDEDDLAALFYRITDGWAAGVVLLAEHFRQRGRDAVPRDKSHLPEEIMDYFAHEVCGTIDADLLDFLLKTSFLPQMNPYTAQAISGNRHAGRILSRLYRNSRFTERRTLKPLVYQYHPLFRQFLQRQVQSSLSEEETGQLKLLAADLMARTGQTEEAVDLLLSCGSYEAAIHIILDRAESMIAGGRARTLEAWLGRIPSAMYENYPWLHYWLGMCRYHFFPGNALKAFKDAFFFFTAQGNDTGALMSWCGAVDSILLERSDFRRLDSWADWLEIRLQQDPVFPSPEIESRVTACMIGLILFRNPEYPGAHRWFKQAEELICDPLSPNNAAGFFYLIMHHLMFGNTLNAGLLLKRMEPLIDSSSPPVLRIKWCLIRAMYFRLTGKSGKEILHLVEEGLTLARETGIHVFDIHLQSQGVHGGLNSYDSETSRHYLENMAATVSDRRQWDVSNYHLLSAWERLCQDDIQSSQEHLQAAVRITEKIGCTFSWAMGHAGLALACLEGSGQEGFAEHLGKARQLLPGRSDIPEFLYLCVEALACFRSRKEARGAVLLASALPIARKKGFFSAPFWKQEVMSLLCAKALEHGIETEYVRELIIRRSLLPLPGKEQEAYLLDWPFPLRIFSLGRFEVHLYGKLLQPGARGRGKPMELLKVLVAYGGQEVSHQKIMDALYPDSDGDRANYSFKFALHQLRTQLGSGGFLISREGRLSLDARRCLLDSEAFLHLCSRIRKAHDELRISSQRSSRAGEINELIMHLCGKVLHLYKGDFLPGDESDFATSSRESLRVRFLEVVDIAGSCLEKADRNREALQLYERSIETDNLQEEFYRRLMRCLARNKRTSEIQSVYDRCCRVLKSRLDSPPSPETSRVYKSLIQQ